MRSSVDSILWSCYAMIGFVMTTNLSQLKIAQLRSKNKLIGHIICEIITLKKKPRKRQNLCEKEVEILLNWYLF